MFPGGKTLRSHRLIGPESCYLNGAYSRCAESGWTERFKPGILRNPLYPDMENRAILFLKYVSFPIKNEV
jgi:hypothetical protein